MEQTRSLFCTCNSGVAQCQSQHQCHILFVCLCLLLYVPSPQLWSPNHTFSCASLNKQLTSTSCTYFHLTNGFDVRSELHGKASLAAVKLWCRSWGYERLQFSKEKFKACFENVNITSCTLRPVLWWFYITLHVYEVKWNWHWRLSIRQQNLTEFKSGRPDRIYILIYTWQQKKRIFSISI